MKTRSNMPLFVLECGDVKALSNSQIDLLRCGDYLVKKDASGEHAYKVTFKSDTGMCITYHDASVIETQSYDKVDGNWVYNSEDKTPNLLNAQTEDDVKDLVEGGTLDNAKPIYFHPILIQKISGDIQYSVSFIILNNDSTAFTMTSFKKFVDDLYTSLGSAARMICSGGWTDSATPVVSIACFAKIGSNNYIFVGHDTDSFAQKQGDWDSLWDTPTEFRDGVNKIN